MLILTVNGAYFIKLKLAKIVTLNMNFVDITLNSYFKDMITSNSLVR